MRFFSSSYLAFASLWNVCQDITSNSKEQFFNTTPKTHFFNFQLLKAISLRNKLSDKCRGLRIFTKTSVQYYDVCFIFHNTEFVLQIFYFNPTQFKLFGLYSMTPNLQPIWLKAIALPNLILMWHDFKRFTLFYSNGFLRSLMKDWKTSKIILCLIKLFKSIFLRCIFYS